MQGRMSRAKLCGACIPVRAVETIKRSRERHPQSKWALKAHAAVNAAIKKGALPKPGSFSCTDCKVWKAQCYDHRDYNKPLDVEPVCYGCNAKRGPAIPHVDEPGGSLERRHTKEAPAI